MDAITCGLTIAPIIVQSRYLLTEYHSGDVLSEKPLDTHDGLFVDFLKD